MRDSSDRKERARFIPDLDYGRRMIHRRDERVAELDVLEQDAIRLEGPIYGSQDLAAGISVIIPSHRGRDRIEHTLNALARQTLPWSDYEVIIVANGPKDGTEDVVRAWSDHHPDLLIRYFWTPFASAGGARNKGLALARRKYLTFVDDDDDLEGRYLAALYEIASPRVVAVAPIIDRESSGRVTIASSLNARILSLGSGRLSLNKYPWLLGFNASKMIATELARSMRFNPSLSSGEDVAYWADLLNHADLEIELVKSVTDAGYIRVLRSESVSRQELTFQFAVKDRLAVIKQLGGYEAVEGGSGHAARRSLVDAQIGFIARFAQDNPDSMDAVADEIVASGVRGFPWTKLNTSPPRHLAISYCFAPFSDTSAVVAAKAIAERRRVVDVITNDMSAVRRRDPAVSELANRWIRSVEIIDSRPAFADWNLISDFAQKALQVAERNNVLNLGYESMYSRALWVGSHVAAALFKLRHNRVHWSAEFSDPLSRGADGRARPGAIVENDTSRALMAAVKAYGFAVDGIETLFELAEVSTYIFADELIFTNENQLEYMLSLRLPDGLAELVRKKATVREHPQPAASAYTVSPTSYPVPLETVNIGYFGSFYPSRGIDDVLIAIANLPVEVRRHLRFHVFSNKRDDVEARSLALGVGDCVYANPYLDYMEFLNATTKFDVLLVNDVERGPELAINPFLPSKLSDYRGSGSDIWAIYDEGSVLSREPARYKDPVGSAAALQGTLIAIVNDWLHKQNTGNGSRS